MIQDSWCEGPYRHAARLRAAVAARLASQRTSLGIRAASRRRRSRRGLLAIGEARTLGRLASAGADRFALPLDAETRLQRLHEVDDLAAFTDFGLGRRDLLAL